MRLTGAYNHTIQGQKRTITGQYVYTTVVVQSVPNEAQRNAPKVTRADIDNMTLWGK